MQPVEVARPQPPSLSFSNTQTTVNATARKSIKKRIDRLSRVGIDK
eukprot:gene3974-6430_t